MFALASKQYDAVKFLKDKYGQQEPSQDSVVSYIYTYIHTYIHT